MHKNRDNPDSVYTKALLQIKSLRLFPVLSLAYAFSAAVILFFSLLIVDAASGYDQYFSENRVVLSMAHEQKTKAFDYPLMAIRGREEIRTEHPKILVLGDSFVFGDGLSNINQIWWNILQSELGRRGYDCAVYAAGTGEISTYDEYLWLRDTSLLEDIQPDLIIIGYVTNDADLGSMDSGMGLKYYATTLYTKNFMSWLRPAFPGIFDWVESKILGKIMMTENRYNNSEYGYIYPTWEQKILEGEYLEAYNTRVLRPLGAFIRELGIPLIVIPTPEAPSKSYFEPLYQNVLPLFEQAGLPVYNPLDLFVEQYSDGKYDDYFLANPVNKHPGPATSLFLGQYAADVLEQHYPSILGEKSERDKTKLSIEVNDWLPFMLGPQAIQESGAVSQYTIEYPDQSSKADPKAGVHGNFLTHPLGKKYVKLNFKYPVRLSGVQIEGEDLLSAEVYTLAINEKLGFDDQKPVRLGGRRGNRCTWEDGSGRYVTSLLISAKTKDGKQAALTVTIESDSGEEAFY